MGVDKRKNVIVNLCILRTWCAVNPDYGMGLDVEECGKAVGWLDDAIGMMQAEGEGEGEAQEPVEPILKREAWNKYYNYYVCPVCGEDLVYEQNYCSECGRAVKWND